MKKRYTKLKLRERERLAIGLAKGKSLRRIARELGRSHSTLSRELKNHHISENLETYSPSQSNAVARIFRRRAGRKRVMKNELICKYVEKKIKGGWSPEQISGRLSFELAGLRVSHETIYQYIYDKADHLVWHLARRHKFRRKKRKYRRAKRSTIPNGNSIDTRPNKINRRKEFGHWESDSIVSKQSRSVLNVLVERRSRAVKITKLSNGKSLTTYNGICECLSTFPSEARQSITYDNGTENVLHQEINGTLDTDSYFCNPYHSWEKGTVENTNSLIRRYIPKKTNLDDLTEEDIAYVEKQLNNRPRKCLGYMTPQEVFNNFLQMVR